MLVTLGSNASLAAGASQTFQYACTSVQSVNVRVTDAGQALKPHLTIQIGNDVICNDISFHGLALLSLITGGGQYHANESTLKVNLGSHILEPLENLYVTVRNADASAVVDAVDISAIVNEGGIYEPLKYTNYSDSVFTDSNTLSVYAWADTTMADDTSAFTIRNQAYSATPQVQSGCTLTNVNAWAEASSSDHWKYIATMAKNQVPLDTSINYSSTIIDGVICVSAMPKMPSKAQASGQAGRAVLSAMTSSERKAL